MSGKMIEGKTVSRINKVGNFASFIICQNEHQDDEELIPIMCESTLADRLSDLPIGSYVLITGQVRSRNYVDGYDTKEINELVTEDILVL